MLQMVLTEARKTIEEQESVNGELIVTVQRMRTTMINAQEDAEEYRVQHEKIKAEGQALYGAYATRCEKVKMLTAQLLVVVQVGDLALSPGAEHRLPPRRPPPWLTGHHLRLSLRPQQRRAIASSSLLHRL